MFILKSTHDRVVMGLQSELLEKVRRLSVLTDTYDSLLERWNKLVGQINSKGGEQFLEYGQVSTGSPQLSDDEIKKLLSLCHPDKHGGKPLADEMTKRLLELRK